MSESRAKQQLTNCASRGPESCHPFKANTESHTCATGYWYCRGKVHLLNFRCLLLEKKKKNHIYGYSDMADLQGPKASPVVMVIQEDRNPSVFRDFCTERCFCLCSDMRSLHCLTFSAENVAGFVLSLLLGCLPAA